MLSLLLLLLFLFFSFSPFYFYYSNYVVKFSFRSFVLQYAIFPWHFLLCWLCFCFCFCFFFNSLLLLALNVFFFFVFKRLVNQVIGFTMRLYFTLVWHLHYSFLVSFFRVFFSVRVFHIPPFLSILNHIALLCLALFMFAYSRLRGCCWCTKFSLTHTRIHV